MNWDSLFAYPEPIPVHALMAMAALGLGGAQLLLPKGTGRHRVTGYLWIVLMAGIAVTGLFIHEIRMIGPFSPIHLLSLLVLFNLFNAIRYARSGNIDRHGRTMKQLFFFALVVAGAFTLLPGRAMNTLFLGE
ncbi:MAG: DUF2306 domain-containing protein [Alphaproteobacteria bacterium]